METGKLKKRVIFYYYESLIYYKACHFFSISNKDSYFSATNDLQEESSKNFKTLLTTKNSQRDTFTDANTIIGSSSLTNPSDVLDVIVEATYNMYV